MTGTPVRRDPWESERRRLVAAEIRSWLGRRQWSQAALAEAIGRSEMYVSRCLRGIRAFNIDDLFAIADALDVPADVFLHVKRADGTEFRQPRPPAGRSAVAASLPRRRTRKAVRETSAQSGQAIRALRAAA